MVGGEEDIFNRAIPVFEAMGKNITLTGPSGMGQTTKLINQILVSNTMNAVAEALVFAAKAGANLDTTIEAVSGGAASSWQLSNLGTRAIKGDFSPGFMVKLQQKDLRLILEMARELNIPVPSTSLVHQLYSSLEAEGRGDEGTQSLVRIYEKLAGVEARSE
jgi:3-hydroxyisobutyrate dehydrogenase